MALVDYAQKRQERINIRSQVTMGVFNMPTARDAVKLRGEADIPSVLSDFVRSEEVRDTPDTDQYIKRKKPPGEFEMTTYAKVPSTKGRLPQWGALARDTFGIELMIITILDFADLDANNNTVTITIDGVSTVLTEEVEWNAATSNAATATSLAAAIHALTGVSAVAVGDEVRVSRDNGAGDVAITTNANPLDLTIGEVRYQLATDILEQAFTLIHGTHNAVHYYRDCKVSNLQINASGSDESTLVWSGFLGNETFMAQSKLEGTIPVGAPRTSADLVSFALETSVIQIGPTAEDFVWFTVDAEHFRVVSWDPDAKTGTAFGCQFGSAAAAHADAAEVFPYFPAADPDPNDHIIPLTLGFFKLDGVSYRVVSIEFNKDEQLIARLDEAFEAALTGYKRPIEGRLVEGTLIAYQRLAIMELQTYSEREKQSDCDIMLGAATGPRIEVNIPRFRIGKVEKGESEGEFTRTFPFQGLASGTPGNDGVDLVIKQ
jgi:hypothetical protein